MSSQALPIQRQRFQVPEGDFLQFLRYISTSGLCMAIVKTTFAPLERLKLIYQVNIKIGINSSII